MCFALPAGGSGGGDRGDGGGHEASQEAPAAAEDTEEEDVSTQAHHPPQLDYQGELLRGCVWLQGAERRGRAACEGAGFPCVCPAPSLPVCSFGCVCLLTICSGFALGSIGDCDVLAGVVRQAEVREGAGHEGPRGRQRATAVGRDAGRERKGVISVMKCSCLCCAFLFGCKASKAAAAVFGQRVGLEDKPGARAGLPGQSYLSKSRGALPSSRCFVCLNRRPKGTLC